MKPRPPARFSALQTRTRPNKSSWFLPLGIKNWQLALAIGLLLALTYVILPYGRAASLLYVVSTVLAAAAIWAGVWFQRGQILPLPWTLIASALTLAAVGHAIWYVLDLQGLEPMPSAADAFYLAVYPLFMIALWQMGRSAGKDGALTDALIVGVSAGVLGWAFLVAPHLDNPDLSLGQLMVSAGYPVADLLVLPLLLRFVFLHRMGITAHLFLLAGMVAYLLADVLYAHGNIADWYGPGGFTDGLWLVAYTLFVAAIWHPSAKSKPQSRATRIELSKRRLLVLTIAATLVPALILLTADDDAETVRIAAIASIFIFLLVLSRLSGLLNETHHQAQLLAQLASTDPLTQAANRRQLTQVLAKETERVQRSGRLLCVAMLDLDHFKDFNDRYGHPEGDRLLRWLADNWRGELRQTDLLARYGGEEFAVVLPETDIKACRELLERLRVSVPLKQTCSVGFTCYQPGDTAKALLARADQALYQAKNRGRNRLEGPI